MKSFSDVESSVVKLIKHVYFGLLNIDSAAEVRLWLANVLGNCAALKCVAKTGEK